jgi:transcriptional regulator with XRE-family HTH domain
MTEHEKSLLDEYEETDEGTQDLAAADLATQVVSLIHEALIASDLDQKALAAKLGVSEGRISQVVNGDGNLRIAAVARYLRALGYTTSISAQPAESGRPQLESTPGRAHYPVGTWMRLSAAHATYHAAGTLPRTGLADVSKQWLLGNSGGLNLLATDIGWSEVASFDVDLHSLFKVRLGPGDDEDTATGMVRRESPAGRGR